MSLSQHTAYNKPYSVPPWRHTYHRQWRFWQLSDHREWRPWFGSVCVCWVLWSRWSLTGDSCILRWKCTCLLPEKVNNKIKPYSIKYLRAMLWMFVKNEKKKRLIHLHTDIFWFPFWIYQFYGVTRLEIFENTLTFPESDFCKFLCPSFSCCASTSTSKWRDSVS